MKHITIQPSLEETVENYTGIMNALYLIDTWLNDQNEETGGNLKMHIGEVSTNHRVCTVCKEYKKHCAKGMCRNCWVKDMYKRRPDSLAKRRATSKRYYDKNKGDPKFMERMNKASKKSYKKNHGKDHAKIRRKIKELST